MPRKGKGKATGSTLPGTSAPSIADMASLNLQIASLQRNVITLTNRIHRLENPPQPLTSTPAAIAAATTTSTSRGRSRKKSSRTFSSIPASHPLAGRYPREDSPDRYSASLVIADDLVGHVVGRGGRGLKQVSDISGARLAVFGMTVEGREERHVTIKGTELQLGDALVIIGKRIARKRVHAPAKKKSKGSSADTSVPAPQQAPPALGGTSPVLPRGPGSPALAQGTASPSITITLPPDPSPPTPRGQSTPIPKSPALSRQSSRGSPMAFSTPAGSATPVVPTIVMASPNPTPSGSLTPMEVDHILYICLGGSSLSDPRQRRARAEYLVKQGQAVRTDDGYWEKGGGNSS